MSAEDSDERSVPKKKPLWPIFLFLGLLAILMGVQHYVLGDPIDKVLSKLGLIFAQIAGGLAVFFLGVLLYFFRCRRLYYYGVGEVMVGFLGAVYVIAQIMGAVDGRLAIWLALAPRIVRHRPGVRQRAQVTELDVQEGMGALFLREQR
jgi:hypothetical protein